MDMTGYLTINGVDVWTQFGAFLAETSPDEHSNMDALLRMPKAKEVTTVDFREQHGVSIPQSPDVKLDKIERTLRFWLSADSNVECLYRYYGLYALLVSGVLTLKLKDFRDFKLLYSDMPADPEFVTAADGSRCGVLFSVKFLDYAPLK